MIYRKQSAIGWTDFSGGDLNFVVGCTPASEGCRNCYARRWAETWGRDFSQVKVYPEKMEALLTDKFVGPFKRGSDRPMAFVVDLGDLFHPDVPDQFIMRALEVFTQRSDVDWQVLTKRPERIYDLWGGDYLSQNIWVGVTAENQQRADERLPWLLQIPAAIRFVNVEPMLEPIDIVQFLSHEIEEPRMVQVSREMAIDAGMPNITGQMVEWGTDKVITSDLGWVICGAESGPDRRPFDKAWALDLWRQCQQAGVPFFGKQDSSIMPSKPLLLEGREVKEWPR